MSKCRLEIQEQNPSLRMWCAWKLISCSGSLSPRCRSPSELPMTLTNTVCRRSLRDTHTLIRVLNRATSAYTVEALGEPMLRKIRSHNFLSPKKNRQLVEPATSPVCIQGSRPSSPSKAAEGLRRTHAGAGSPNHKATGLQDHTCERALGEECDTPRRTVCPTVHTLMRLPDSAQSLNLRRQIPSHGRSPSDPRPGKEKRKATSWFGLTPVKGGSAPDTTPQAPFRRPRHVPALLSPDLAILGQYTQVDHESLDMRVLLTVKGSLSPSEHMVRSPISKVIAIILDLECVEPTVETMKKIRKVVDLLLPSPAANNPICILKTTAANEEQRLLLPLTREKISKTVDLQQLLGCLLSSDELPYRDVVSTIIQAVTLMDHSYDNCQVSWSCCTE